MNDSASGAISAKLAAERGGAFRRGLLAAAGVLVALLTAYALILPGATLSNQVFCGFEQHAHSDQCNEQKLVCGIEESAGNPGHVHDDSCYTVEVILVCDLEEGTIEDATAEGIEPVSAEEAAIDPDSALDPASDTPVPLGHVHGDSCYVEQQSLVCGLEEGAGAEVGHSHSEACYESVMSCELPEHEHTALCYSDKTADVETASVWESTLPLDELTGDWASDVLLIAESQLGYEESVANYVVTESGKTKGYTRYGAWYGDAYGDWCAMFASFCLHYAGVDEALMPQDANCQNWIDVLSSEEVALWRPANGDAALYEPKPGDLVFFNWDPEPDSDHVGIVCAITAGAADEPVRLKTIEGNASNGVRYAEYDLSDGSILGYAELPQNPALTEGYALMSLSEDEGSGEGEGGSSDDDEVVHEEESVTGEYWHSKSYKYYEVSAKALLQSDIMTFALIPSSEYSEDWEPNTTTWSAKSDANYLAAYCAECFVTVSDSGAGYGSYTIENSRFATSALRNQLAGIIAHSYPFLTYGEMQAELKAAYENGEIAIDVSGCSESEYMAATQSAIWEVLIPSMDFTQFYSNSDFGSESLQAITINTGTSAGCTEGYDAHCEAIAQWLIGKTIEDDLQVSSYEYDVEKDEYGLYSLSVRGEFNRAVIAGELVSLQLVAGGRATEELTLAAGTKDFDIQIVDLTERELLEAVVSLEVSGKRMQAYYFENAHYQDLISGQWEYYDTDLSFQVTEDSTSVSVKKHWAEEVTEDTPDVEVKLYANGVQVRETVVLNEQNDWSYTWLALDKYDVLGGPISYTVRETPLPGYYSSVAVTEGEHGKTLVWEEASSFEDGERYMLTADTGGFAAVRRSSSKIDPTWTAAHPEDYSLCSPGLVWTAKQAEDGGFYLYNESTGGTLGYRDVLGGVYVRATPYTKNSSNHPWLIFTFDEGILRTSYGSEENLDFCYIGTNGGETTANFRDYTGAEVGSSSYVTKLTLYKLVEVDAPPAEHSFVLTNSKISPGVELVSVSVRKQWDGREDGVYPESVKVQLFQNEFEYGDPVVLSEDCGWMYVWPNLPKSDADGEPIDYAVEELALDGYAVSSQMVTEDDTYAITLTNTWQPEEVDLVLAKADSEDLTRLLPGADFDLYWTPTGVVWGEAEGDLIPGTDGVYGRLVYSVGVGVNGKVALDGLASGETYYLVETKAPAGYNMLEEAVGFKVEKRGLKTFVAIVDGESWAVDEDGNPAVLTIKNEGGHEFPETGGTGSLVYVIAGTTFALVALFGLWVNRRQRRVP